MKRCQNPIGMFDSGIGGLSVWYSIAKYLPNESIIYVGDHAYMPYGNLSEPKIKARAVKIINWLLNRKCKLIVVACNTATVAGLADYRKVFPNVPIIGIVPVIKTATEKTKTKHVAVLATSFTIKSFYHKQLLKTFSKGIQVKNIECPELVPLIESGDVQGEMIKEVIKKMLSSISNLKIDIIVLGCSHYPFIKHIISDLVGKDIMILDSGDAVARQTRRILELNEIINQGHLSKYIFFTTGNAINVSKIASKLLKLKIIFKNTTI
jgi:glutamate racemase